MTEQNAELKQRLRANRFRHEQAGLAAALEALIGTAGGPLEFVTLERADALAAEYLLSHRSAADLNATVEATWPQDEIERAVNFIHGLIEHVGARPTWLVVQLTEPQAVALTSEIVLDNPLGFASLADTELRLLDRELPAGLWLRRHSHHYGPMLTDYAWELTLWGEPWASAATRALRT
ncbi:MAG TPA: hypothetical protein VJN70_03245 [Gemmatimonadaceae bacterium]|nr:hypothetical protein [Gemmatimonadaceae bacterium]